MSHTPNGPSSIPVLQGRIREEIAILSGTPTLLLDYLVEQGAALPPLHPQECQPAYLVENCMARTWLVPQIKQRRLLLKGDSEAAITKGLLGLLIRIFSGQPVEEILATEGDLLPHLGLQGVVGAQRTSGLDGMLRKLKGYAASAQALASAAASSGKT